MKTVHCLCALAIGLGVILISGAPAGAALDPGAPEASPAQALAGSGGVDAGTEHVWTAWNREQYALADDGVYLWIGTGLGAVRWDKAQGTSRRYTTQDGLPSTEVFAVAVDAVGNRWFGGDGGLSRLDGHGAWTHFTTTNSGLAGDLVDGIAITADGSLWLSHGLTDGPMSHLTPTGTWRVFPHRYAAVAAGYPAIVGTQNANPVWTVAGGEVWVGYWVFDGVTWTDRAPGQASQRVLGADGLPAGGGPYPQALAADSRGRVWAIDPSSYPDIVSWDGSAWTGHRNACSYDNFGFQSFTLAVGPDDTVWIGYGWRPPPPPLGPSYAGVAPLEGPCANFNADSPVAAILPTAEGTSAIGPGWLLPPDGQIARLDLPREALVSGVLMDASGHLWLHSTNSALGGGLQWVDDRGTYTLDDDQWQSVDRLDVLNAWDRAPNGDVWVGEFRRFYHSFRSEPPRRWHEGQWITYPGLGWTDNWARQDKFDIFAWDDRQAWFAGPQGELSSYSPYSIMSLDDGGTPEEASDDIWGEYATPTTAHCVAVDARGRPWYGDGQSVYRFDGTAWQLIEQDVRCDMVPAADGTMFVAGGGRVLVVWPDDSRSWMALDDLISDHLDLVRTATWRNSMWTIAAGGGVWTKHLHTASTTIDRYDENGWTAYEMPFRWEQIQGPIEVDGYGHVWMVVDGVLWRLSPRPDFSLDGVSQLWLLEPGGSSSQSLALPTVEGFNLPVTLSLSGLPPNVAAQITPNPAPAGEVVTLTLSADAAAPLGRGEATLLASSPTTSHTLPVAVVVVPQVHVRYLPLIPGGAGMTARTARAAGS